MMAAISRRSGRDSQDVLRLRSQVCTREQNEAADLLSKLGSKRKRIPPGVFLEHLRTPSVKGADIDNPDRVDSFVHTVTKFPPAWTQPFMEYLVHENFLDDEVERRQIVH